MTTKFPECKVGLIGRDGNAFSIIGKVSQELTRYLRKNNYKYDEISSIVEEYRNQATSGDYDNLLCVTMEYVTVF